MITEEKFLLFLIEIICCDPSSEPCCRDGSDDGSQCMFLCRINQNYPKLSSNMPSYLELWFMLLSVMRTYEKQYLCLTFSKIQLRHKHFI